MAVVENAVGSSNRTESHVTNDIDTPKSKQTGTQMPISRSNDQNFYRLVNHQQPQKQASGVQANGQVNYQSSTSLTQLPNGNISNVQTGDIKTSSHHHQYDQRGSNGLDLNINGGDDGGEGIKKEIRDLDEMLSKLNPMAEEFVPTFLVNHGTVAHPDGLFSFASNDFVMQTNSGVANGNLTKRKKYNHRRGKRRINSRTSVAQREDVIRRTVYVSDIDHQVTEEQLAALFISCGQVVDCRVCGDPTSVLHFAFIEFTDEEGARNALSLSGTMLGYYPVRVLPSKTAIAPVNPTFLPRSEDEREMCARTIYCTNIDRKVTQSDVRLFFESFCGEVNRLRLLGDYHHSTRIAFVEFVVVLSLICYIKLRRRYLSSMDFAATEINQAIATKSLHGSKTKRLRVLSQL